MYIKLSKFFLYLIPFSVVIVTPSTLFPFIVGKYVFFRTAVSLSLIFFLLGLLFQYKDIRSYKIGGQYPGDWMSQILKSPLVIAVSLFVFIFLLACFFSVDPKISFWSNFERGEGGLQILYLGVFFLLLVILFRDKKDWQRLFWISILAATLVILYGIAAHLKYIDAEMSVRFENGVEIKELTGRGGPWFQTFKKFVGEKISSTGRFAGSLGNPAYTATYLVFALFYAGYLLITRTNTDNQHQSAKISINRCLLIGLLILFLIFFWLAATRGAFIGLGLAIVVAGLYFAYQYKKWRQWLLAGIIFLFLVVSSLVYFRETPFIKSLPGSRLFEITLSAETWQHRTLMWQAAIKGFKERPLLGWGPENFIKIFSKHFPVKYFNPKASSFGAWFDRAHSIYFDYLAETGLLGLLGYLSIFIVFYWQFFKKTRINTDKKLIYTDKKSVSISQNQHQAALQSALLFALPITYLIQGIVLFETLPLYLNLFIFLAFAAYRFENPKFQAPNNK